MSEDSADNFVQDNWNVVIWGRTIDTIIRDVNLSKHKTCQYKSTHACISFPAHFALNDPLQWIRASSLYSLVFISMFLTYMQLMMLKGSFSSLPSYKYARFKPNFFCGTNDNEEDVEDAACLVFGSCHDHTSRGLTFIILMPQFLENILGDSSG